MGQAASLRWNPQDDAITDGWQGQLSLEFDYIPTINPQNHPQNHQEGLGGGKNGKNGTTRLIHSHSIAPLKVQRPFYPEGPHVCHSVVVHTAGGMVGGDRLNLSVIQQPSTHALVTTAAASKAYKSNGQVATQSIHMKIGEGGCLEWLPQPLIVFNGAQYHQNLRIDLAPGAIWLGWEITRLGRTLRQETFDEGMWRSHLEVWQDGSPVWIDPQWVKGGSEMLTSPHGLAHCPVIGTFAIVGVEPNDNIVHQARQLWSDHQPVTSDYSTLSEEKSLNPISSPLPVTGVSQLQSGIICRYRGPSTIAAQRWFIRVWTLLRQRYLARSSCIPRVWQIR